MSPMESPRPSYYLRLGVNFHAENEDDIEFARDEIEMALADLSYVMNVRVIDCEENR